MPPPRGRSSFMFGWCERRFVSTSGRPSPGPNSSNKSTTAMMASCVASSSALHHKPNSSVYSTSHAIASVKWFYYTMQSLWKLEDGADSTSSSIGSIIDA